MVARIQSKEDEEEESNDQSVSENPNTSPEVENNSENPEYNHHEKEMSPDVQENTRSPYKKSGVADEQNHNTNRHSSSHSSRSKGGKHQESDRSKYSSREKDERHSLSREQKTSKDEKKNEERRQKSSTGDGKKSSSNSKHSKNETSLKSKIEQSHTKDVKKEENHKSHGSHSKTKDSQSNVEIGDKKDNKLSERKHSSRDSSKHSGHKHGHSSNESSKSESRHSEHKRSSSQSSSKDKTPNKHSDHSGSHSKHDSSNPNSKNHHDKRSYTYSEENCDKTRHDMNHSSSKSGDREVTKTKRTLSDSESENSVEETDVVDHNQSKVLGQWNGFSSDGEMEDEPGGFSFNDEYVDHEALLNEALNKYHMEPQVPKREDSSSISDKKSHNLSSGEMLTDYPNKGKNSDSHKRRRTDDDKERSSSHKEKVGKDDSGNRSHSSHNKSRSSSSSKSSSHKQDKEDRKRKHEQDNKSESKKSRSSDQKQDNKSESKKSRSSDQSKEVVSFEESIVVPVKKPKADPNYEKLKSKFKIKKKGEASEEKKSKAELTSVKGDMMGSDKVKVPTPASKLKLSERDLASLVRNNTTPTFYQVDENLSAADQFDDSLIGQKSYARTQVYSGKKNNVVPIVVSLQEICVNLLMNHIDSIEAVGSAVPFYILEPVLKKCTPAQLYRLEDFNPHFLEDSDPLWKLHCEREFRGSEPDEFESYRELYLRKFDEKERKLKAIKDNISQSMAKAVPERTAKLAYIDSYVKPPREVRRQQLKYGTAGSSSGERSKKFAHLMDPIAIGRKDREDKAVRQKAPMMQKTLMMLKKIRK
ncbi:transcription elongation factor B polypeptide 3-like isoform X2 [Ostrea edulis]|nr:transcription elongation factor B polypeptide 3-like isoform X2 [Ostrea edulis]